MAVSTAQKTHPLSLAAFRRTWQSEILTNDDQRMWGQTTFKGTRVLASTLFEYLSAGQTIDDFLADFPMERSAVVALLNEIQELLTP